jgi:hypothetical protein
MNELKLTRRLLAIFFIAVVSFSSCKKEKARVYELLPPDPENVTSQGILSVSIENTGGPSANEGSIRLTDGDPTSKFLIFTYDPSLWMQLKFKKAQHITSYTLTSANDGQTRDPKNWKLSGSNDGLTWVDLDTRTDEVFTDRGQTKNYEFENSESYTYYRISITANNGSTLFQLAEWSVTNVPLQ